METVVHDTKMMDSKFTLEIQQIKDALKEDKASHQVRMKELVQNVVSGKCMMLHDRRCSSSRYYRLIIINR